MKKAELLRKLRAIMIYSFSRIGEDTDRLDDTARAVKRAVEMIELMTQIEIDAAAKWEDVV